MCGTPAHETGDCSCFSNKKFDPTKPVQTRYGRKARIICTDAKTHKDRPIVYLIEQNGGEIWNTCDRDGKACYRENDLVNVPVIRHEYQYVYQTNTPAKRHKELPKIPNHVVTFGKIQYTFEDDVLTKVELM